MGPFPTFNTHMCMKTPKWPPTPTPGDLVYRPKLGISTWVLVTLLSPLAISKKDQTLPLLGHCSGKVGEGIRIRQRAQRHSTRDVMTAGIGSQ